jgi:DNA repair protein RadC
LATIVLLLVFSGEAVWLHYISHVTGNQALHHQAFPDNILHISIEDVAVTREIVQAGKILDIDVLDHLVIGAGQKFVSLKERGLGF